MADDEPEEKTIDDMSIEEKTAAVEGIGAIFDVAKADDSAKAPQQSLA